MVNTTRSTGRLDRVATLIAVYVAVVLATIVGLGLLAALAPRQATAEAWIHALIVAVFAVLLPLRLRSARRGAPGADRAVGIIAAVLATVNIVEALIPDLFPVWMRVEMSGVAALMVAVVGLVFLRPLRARTDAAQLHGRG